MENESEVSGCAARPLPAVVTQVVEPEADADGVVELGNEAVLDQLNGAAKTQAPAGAAPEATNVELAEVHVAGILSGWRRPPSGPGAGFSARTP